ncbi:hypothetical protein M422DRAFT_56715 [Sphaerobolus stellatus SS14]|uniref:Uncharacterized protein n=1 Tax=Sphaerobolus stellatus (strain SS14) TaxID=990650 RepID=A0A0C9T4E3_SPHS4|nr:hypothetical protein M422DRAFT_56715 [Sphaerobolus stellatus SS14]
MTVFIKGVASHDVCIVLPNTARIHDIFLNLRKCAYIPSIRCRPDHCLYFDSFQRGPLLPQWTLHSIGVQDLSTLHFRVRFRGGAPQHPPFCGSSKSYVHHELPQEIDELMRPGGLSLSERELPSKIDRLFRSGIADVAHTQDPLSSLVANEMNRPVWRSSHSHMVATVLHGSTPFHPPFSPMEEIHISSPSLQPSTIPNIEISPGFNSAEGPAVCSEEALQQFRNEKNDIEGRYKLKLVEQFISSTSHSLFPLHDELNQVESLQRRVCDIMHDCTSELIMDFSLLLASLQELREDIMTERAH